MTDRPEADPVVAPSTPDADPHAEPPAFQADPRAEPPAPVQGRPLLERVGMAAVAGVLAALFGGVAVAAWAGGEVFLAVMAGIGALMTAWAGAHTMLRG